MLSHHSLGSLEAALQSRILLVFPALVKGKLGVIHGLIQLRKEEAELFLGKIRFKGSAMVAPELAEWVAKEAEREAAIAKELRKAREERKG